MKESRNAFKFLLLASALTTALWFVPYAEIITYPFKIFVTFIHETGHALGALLTFGHVSGMNVNPDGSGVTYTSGGINFVVSSAGYLGSTLFGALLLMLCHRGTLAKASLAAIAVGILAVTNIFIGFGYVTLALTAILAAVGLIWVGKPELGRSFKATLATVAAVTFFGLVAFLGATNSLFAWVMGLGLGMVLFLCAKFLNPTGARFLLSFLAVQCCLNALLDLVNLIYLSTYSMHTHTDAMNMQSNTGIPAIIWALLWSVTSIVVLVAALWSYRRALFARLA